MIRLKDDQLQMKDERSFIKDETILNLRNELNEQYIKADEKIRELTKQLDEAKSNQDFFDNPTADLSKNQVIKFTFNCLYFQQGILIRPSYNTRFIVPKIIF